MGAPTRTDRTAVAARTETGRLCTVTVQRVCEIGTGTGYNAVLLAHRLGAANVVSVEIDPVLADRARQALAAAGYPASRRG